MAQFDASSDMTVVAKAMSNGYAMGAVVGSSSVMEPAGQIFDPGHAGFAVLSSHEGSML